MSCRDTLLPSVDCLLIVSVCLLHHSYSADGRYLVSRDYLSVKIWDVNMQTRPVKTVSLHDYLRPMLYDLYTSDIIFDKFEVCCSPDGKSVATGSYRCATCHSAVVACLRRR